MWQIQLWYYLFKTKVCGRRNLLLIGFRCCLGLRQAFPAVTTNPQFNNNQIVYTADRQSVTVVAIPRDLLHK